MIHSRKKLTIAQMAGIAKCNDRSVTPHTQELAVVRRRKSSSSSCWAAAKHHSHYARCTMRLSDWKPGLYAEEVAIFLCDEFNVLPSPPSIKQALRKHGQKRKHSREQKNRTLNCGVSISISYPSSIHAIWFLLMSLDVINGYGVDRLAGLHLG